MAWKVILNCFYFTVDLEARPDVLAEPDSNNIHQNLDKTIGVEPQLGSEGAMVGDPVVSLPQIPEIDMVAEDGPAEELAVCDDPYIGQEFVSEEAALAFYDAYSMRVGFVTRKNYFTRCKHDGSVNSRTVVCNKEGFRRSTARSKNVRERFPTRVGCDAVLTVKKMSTGKWIVSKFIKEHNHPLSGSSGIVVYQSNPEEDKRVKELTKQLLIERKRSASLRQYIDLLFSHIEEHTEGLSKKIQYIVDNVNKLESEEKTNKNANSTDN